MRQAQLAIALLLLLTACSCEQREPFNRAAWLNPANRLTRIGMARDLVASERLVGLDTAQVEQLLGPPDRTFAEPTEFTYKVGRGDVDDWWMGVRFERGAARQVLIRPD